MADDLNKTGAITSPARYLPITSLCQSGLNFKLVQLKTLLH